VRLCLPLLLSACKVPDFDDAITTATGEMLQRIWILCKRVYTVNMTRLKTPEEGLRKHALDLCRIESSRVLSRALKWVLVGIQVSRDLGDTGAGRLGRGGRPTEGFNLHLGVSCAACPVVRSSRIGVAKLLAGLRDF